MHMDYAFVNGNYQDPKIVRVREKKIVFVGADGKLTNEDAKLKSDVQEKNLGKIIFVTGLMLTGFIVYKLLKEK